MRIKAIGLWQPYATLVSIGAKRWETRSHPLLRSVVGQRIAIHATQKKPAAVLKGLPPETVASIMGAFNANHVELANLPLGALICTAVVAHTWQNMPYDADTAELSEVDFQAPDLYGDYSPYRWISRLEDVQPFEKPKYCVGRQGLFYVDM